MRHPAPRPGREAGPFWEAARQGRLSIPHCAGCDRFVWPPSSAPCRRCGARAQWREARGTGTLESWSVVHRATNPAFREAVPYVVAFVALDDGVRLMSNVVGCDPERLRAGQRLAVRFEETDDPEIRVPVFSPMDEEDG